MQKHRGLWISIFLAPTVLLFLFLFALPVGTVLFTSLFRWKNFSPMAFIGFENYKNLFFHDGNFNKAFINTLIWIILQASIHVFIGTLVAILISQKPFGWKFIRTAYLIPNIISTAALAMLFLNLFNPSYGVVNSIIKSLVNPEFSKNWFFEDSTAFITLTLSWLIYAGNITILVYAEIMAIPESIHEAAIIDGSTPLQYTVLIMLPLLKNIVGSCSILAAASMLKEFDLIYLITNGGPGNLTLNLPLYLYKSSMLEFDFGYSNTIGTVLIMMGVVIILTLNRLFKIGKTE